MRLPTLFLVLPPLLASPRAFAQPTEPPADPSTPTSTPTPTPPSPPPPDAPPAPVSPLEDLPDLARPTPVPPPRHQTRIFGSIEGAYSYQSLYGIPINGFDITGLIGGDFGSWGLGGELEVVPGRTDGGLAAYTVTVGFLAEAHFDRLRFGGGIRVGVLNINRVTTGGSIGSASIGLVGRISYDLLRFDNEGNGAFFVVGKASLDSVGDSLYGVTLGLGVRF
jgi:hypothetical protein